MQIHEVRCFGERAGQGNPALVVQGGPDDPAARQAFAQASGVSACVFIDGERLDYYYPHMRSPLCLHATLAAAHVLFAQRGAPAALSATTALRGQRLTLSREGAAIFVALGRMAVEAVAPPSGLLAELLGAPGLVPASAPVVASVGSAKLLVEVADSATLAGLRPDLARLVAWGLANGVNGCYAYCRTGATDYEGRNFNHLDAAREDSATGVAAGALSAALGHGLTLRQGHALGQPCRILTRVDGATIYVGGATELRIA
ncbi:MAG: PhzF family phenazine biosynthesis protein [Pseudomonadota bacterium]|nr:PhzF family phenazine biosynthesis protein [Pseudomonadota bacterium]